MILIVRHNFETSEDDHPYSFMPTLNFANANGNGNANANANANAMLATLAPGLRPKRRFAPLARGPSC